MQPIHVVTAELSSILSDIIGAALDSAGDIQVVGEALNHGELVELTRRLRPDVVIMGGRLGPYGLRVAPVRG